MKTPILVAALGCLTLLPALGQYVFFVDDFESAETPTNPGSDQLLYPEEDGLIVGANRFNSSNVYLDGYFSFPAPNNAFGAEVDVPAGAFCNIATGEGGAEQGEQVLTVYNDYNNNAAQEAGELLDANVYLEYYLVEEDLGTTVTFVFDAKMGNLDLTPLTGVPAGSAPPFTPEAEAFVKVLNPLAGFVTDVADVEDATLFPETWETYSVSIDIPDDEEWVGRALQAGFRNKTSQYQGSGIFYDNISLTSNRVEVLDPVPMILSTAKTGNKFSATFQSDPGFEYEFLKGQSPEGPYDDFVDFVVGDGSVLTVSDFSATEDRAFYKLESLPIP
ncbi:hypothetical protein [Haloferula sp.]|uniref:hypothetical protein n=1 Tax=Haloferula sp. TaxID=2497595 RepID=UPI003C76971C